MNPRIKHLSALAASSLLGFVVGHWVASDSTDQPQNNEQAVRKPLYWVAPMDPNYRRNAPGKSPMGMDLVPVYADGAKGSPQGTVLIDPTVVNNLGVRTAEVTEGILAVEIKSIGRVEYDEAFLYHIHPRVEGWIETLNVTAAGDSVTKGSPLYAIYSPTLVNAQEELLLAWERNNPALIKAAMARLKALEVPTSAIEELRASGQVSRTVTISNTHNGVVHRLNVRQGMYVRPEMEMLSIAQADSIWVIADIYESQLSQVAPGVPVTIQTDAYPGRRWQGSVDYVYPELDPITRSAKIRITVDNPDGALLTGMYAETRISVEQDSALLIPKEALISSGSQYRVVVALGEGRFRSVEVTPGLANRDSVAILQGLKGGERVVTSAQFLIDSESNKTADFARMNHSSSLHDTMEHDTMDHSTMDHGSMDHSTMDHETMNHETMDHESMNHDTMDHSTMNHDTMDHSTMDHGDIHHD